MRVLQVIDGLGIGGAETLLRSLVLYLQTHGHSVHVAYSTPGAIAGDLARCGVSLTRVPRLGRLDPLMTMRLARVMRRERPEVVHTHLFKSDVHGRLAAHWRRVPVVVSTAHNCNRWGRIVPIGYLYGLTARLADRVIAVSDDVRDWQIRHGLVRPDKVVTIESGVDLWQFEGQESAGRAARDALGIAPGTPLLGAVGRLTPQKDHACLVRAAARILSRLPSARFIVAGDGPLRTKLTALAEALGVGGAITFCGGRDDVPALLAAVDVLVFSSRWEGVPLALLEGMASARPIVATAVGGVPGTVTDGESALLVPPDDPTALADACLKVLADERLAARLSEGARIRVRQRPTLESALARTEALYEELTRDAAAARS